MRGDCMGGPRDPGCAVQNTHQRVNFLLDACASGVASALRFQEAGASCCQADEHGAAHARGVEVLLLVSRIFSGNSASSMQRFESPLQSTSPPAALRRGVFISGGPEDDGHGAYLRPPGGLGWDPRGEQAACLSRPSKGNEARLPWPSGCGSVPLNPAAMRRGQRCAIPGLSGSASLGRCLYAATPGKQLLVLACRKGSKCEKSLLPRRAPLPEGEEGEHFPDEGEADSGLERPAHAFAHAQRVVHVRRPHEMMPTEEDACAAGEQRGRGVARGGRAATHQRIAEECGAGGGGIGA